jgi:hypothetical protein
MMVGEYNPDYVSHPRETVKDLIQEKTPEIIDKLLRLKFPHTTMSLQKFLEEDTDINSESAFMLHVITGVTPDFWYKRQDQYDEWKKKQGENQ